MAGPTENESLRAELFSPASLRDPYPTYHHIRQTDPVYWHEPFGAWVLTRYDDVRAALHDPRLRSDRVSKLREGGCSDELAPLFDLIGAQMNLVDPPRHTRLRHLVSHAFTPRAVEGLSDTVEGLVDRLLDAVHGQGRLDVIADFAFPLPATVIAAMLGLPEGDLERLKRWSDDYATVFGSDPSAVTREQYVRASNSTQELTEYFREQFASRRTNPGSDLLSALVVANQGEVALTEVEMVANANLLLGAGHETTTHLIGNGLLALLRHPDQLEILRADPSRIPGAVEEFLRYDAPIHFMYRLAGEDMELGGKRIRAGQLVYLMFGAANRDPAHFPDPDRLDVTRPPSRHLAFGEGPHFCLGAPLARLEARVAFVALLRRFGEMRLEREELDYVDNHELRGLKALPIVFTTS